MTVVEGVTLADAAGMTVVEGVTLAVAKGMTVAEGVFFCPLEQIARRRRPKWGG
jgi:hypothetical protein